MIKRTKINNVENKVCEWKGIDDKTFEYLKEKYPTVNTLLNNLDAIHDVNDKMFKTLKPMLLYTLFYYVTIISFLSFVILNNWFITGIIVFSIKLSILFLPLIVNDFDRMDRPRVFVLNMYFLTKPSIKNIFIPDLKVIFRYCRLYVNSLTFKKTRSFKSLLDSFHNINEMVIDKDVIYPAYAHNVINKIFNVKLEYSIEYNTYFPLPYSFTHDYMKDILRASTHIQRLKEEEKEAECLEREKEY